VKLIDLNLLLYAVNRDSAKHAAAKAWLEQTLSAAERVAMPWVVLLGFIRVATDPSVLRRPLSADDALAVVDSWLSQAQVIPLYPGEDHWSILRSLLTDAGTAGNLTTDAHLAALAIEHGAELCSTDSDFARFRTLRWVNPLDRS
jgi:toxin-antitoxin system PIN domain toxin